MPDVMRLYSIYDVVAEEYGPLFEAKNDAVARRQFQALAQQHKFDVHSGDFQLWYFGQFGKSSGELDVQPPLRVYLNVVDTEGTDI